VTDEFVVPEGMQLYAVAYVTTDWYLVIAQNEEQAKGAARSPGSYAWCHAMKVSSSTEMSAQAMEVFPEGENQRYEEMW